MPEYITDHSTPCRPCRGSGREDTGHGTTTSCLDCGGTGRKSVRVDGKITLQGVTLTENQRHDTLITTVPSSCVGEHGFNSGECGGKIEPARKRPSGTLQCNFGD